MVIKREKRKADDIHKHCGTCKAHKTIRRERERGEELVIFISIAAPARPIKPSGRREREEKSW